MIFEEIIKGCIVGLAVSAPVGPLGVLCIQRTLNKGKWSGVVTGLGATTSDIIYAMLVGFGMNFMMEFIDDHQYWIQLLGSLVIWFFGFKISRSKVTPRDKKNYDRRKKMVTESPALNKVEDGLLKDYLTAFGLCFSNPLIIFLFIGLFAQFHLFATDSIAIDLMTILSIIGGAFVWWLILTWFVGKFKENFRERGLKILNKITGGILMSAAIISAVYSICKLIIG